MQATLITGATELTVPLPFCTVQLCAGGPGGEVSTVTSYVLPLATGVENRKLDAPAGTLRLEPPLFCSTSPATRSPEIEPPIA